MSPRRAPARGQPVPSTPGDLDAFMTGPARERRCYACTRLTPEERAALDDALRRYPHEPKRVMDYLRAPRARQGCGFTGPRIEGLTLPMVRGHKLGGHHAGA